VSEQQEHQEQQVEAPSDLEAEIARLEDRFKRSVADLDNYRKRAAREIERRSTESTDAMLAGWLEVADSVERALAMHAEGPPDEGLQAVRRQIEATLERQGVRRIGHPGEPFDPERHEAVDVQPTTDVPDRTIVSVVRSGYERDGRVLRPALVVVSQRPRTDTATEGTTA
jgi:molecular chaperone GrpE